MINKDLWFSKKGLGIVIFVVIVILMPACEYYFNISFSKVFPIVLVNTYFVVKAIIYDRKDMKKIIFDIMFSIVITALCLYL